MKPARDYLASVYASGIRREFQGRQAPHVGRHRIELERMKRFSVLINQSRQPMHDVQRELTIVDARAIHTEFDLLRSSDLGR